MGLIPFLILLVIAGICGSLGAGLGGYSRAGCLGSIVLGFIGAFFGQWMARQFGLPHLLNVEVGNVVFPIVWSVVGAAVFVAVLGLFSGRRN
ncbi:MAG TPA: GlsB/YeaQ/YmgE family stress response membrane protein [Terriglobales bacterium]|nr:GlsB/YeaQ/YmgE family stress response membrane protein [Terriglobales bacterium]